MIHAFTMLLIYVRCMLFIPHYILFSLNKVKYEADFKKWKKEQCLEDSSDFVAFIKLFLTEKSYRSVFYHRMGFDSRLISWLAPRESTLYLFTDSADIGEGFYINHGFATVLNAKKVGRNFQVWQNVTIGVGHQYLDDRPVIGDNVRICAGAIVCGDINIGDNVIVGAGAVVMKSVPANCVVVGNPARIIRNF